MSSSGNFLIVLLLYSSFDFTQPRDLGNLTEDHHWDVLILALEWPTAACNRWKEWNTSNKCYMPSTANSWAIHGVWPSKFGTNAPNFCNRSANFDPEAIETIQTELFELWANVWHGKSSYSLWSHEWIKHGTCAAVLENFNTELKYFTRGLEYYKTCNISNILREAGIVPSVNKSYSIVNIVNAVRVHLGVNPIVKCSKQNSLFDIRICFSKKSKPVDCNGVLYDYSNGVRHITASDNLLTNCNRTEPIWYLPYNTSASSGNALRNGKRSGKIQIVMYCCIITLYLIKVEHGKTWACKSIYCYVKIKDVSTFLMPF